MNEQERQRKITNLSNEAKEHFKNARHNEAVECYTKSIELDPKNPNTYYSRGNIYFDLKENKKAIADYTKAIEIYPNYYEAYYNRGCIYFDLKEYKKAIADYTKAIKIYPKYRKAYYNRGLLYSRLNINDKAIQDFTNAIEIKPLDALAYYQRGRVYERLGEKDKAKADFEKAIELDPKIAELFKFSNLENYINHLKKLLYGFEDEYKGTKKEVRGYVKLKENFGFFTFMYLGALIIFSYTCVLLGFVLMYFSPLSILLVSPLPFFIHSFLKYRSLEIKIRHRISLLELKEAKMQDDYEKNDLKQKDLESIIENVNSIVFSEIESKSNNNLNFRTPFSNH